MRTTFYYILFHRANSGETFSCYKDVPGNVLLLGRSTGTPDNEAVYLGFRNCCKRAMLIGLGRFGLAPYQSFIPLKQ